MDENTTRTNCHEGGHAVAAIFQRVPFEYVTLDSTSQWAQLGHKLLVDWACDNATLDQIVNRSVVALAGPYAESVITRQAVDTSGPDRDAICRILQSYEPNHTARDSLWRYIQDKTVALVHAHWSFIVLTAEFLEQHRTLSRKWLVTELFKLSNDVGPIMDDYATYLC